MYQKMEFLEYIVNIEKERRKIMVKSTKKKEGKLENYNSPG
jgi:hypothetical protein